ncbi:restriction endonuclease subunit S [Microcoleus sp. Pol10_D6]|uniref:restriction endonuclease subunit S n=1 Tax=Microcoleus sp. Pol10_D6 TaxID=2818875 RepID=UPI002FD4CFC9
MGLVTRTLGEICDEVGGIIRTGPFGSQLHQSDYQDEGLPVIMPKDIVDGRVSVEGITRIGDKDVARLSQHRLQKGNIVYGRRGDIGRRALITEREAGWLCGTGCLRVSLGESVLDPTFLYYYLGESKVIAWIYNQAIGATMPNLNTSIIRRIPITYPPLPIQRKIAAILSAYDRLIENNTRRIEILEEMARSIYREWFVKFRFPGHEQVQMVDSELGLIPEGWEVKILGEVANFYRGKSYKSAELVKDGGLPFLNLKCIKRDGGFRDDGLKRFNGPYKETQTARVGDIIMAVTDMTQERRIVARSALVPRTGEDVFVLSMDLVKIAPKDVAFSNYLYGMLRFSGFADQVKEYANGANVLHLNPNRIEEFKFASPPQDMTKNYARFCGSLYQECDILILKNANLRQTRDLLLPRLISGEIDVENLDINTGEIAA